MPTSLRAGKALEFAFIDLFVETFHIALTADFKGTLEVHFDQVTDFPARPIASLAIGRNSSSNGDDAVAREQTTDKSDALNVGIAVLATKAQPFAQVGAHNITI